jgi:hypothetical protein
MARRPTGLTFAAVREIAAELPDVEEGTAWGVPALKLRGKLLACMASHKSAEPNTLVVRLGFEAFGQPSPPSNLIRRGPDRSVRGRLRVAASSHTPLFDARRPGR